jgi:V-type H+-transporting ATPase subunit C
MSSKVKNDYWLVGVPDNGGRGFRKHENEMQKHGVENYVLNVPKGLRVGTLDDLMSLSDELDKMDLGVSATVKKLGASLYSVTKDSHSSARPEDILLVNGRSMHHYVRNFQWDESRYSLRHSCQDIAGRITNEVQDVEERLREYLGAYSEVSQRISSELRQQSSGLAMCDLSDIVKPRHLDALGSAHFTTLLAVVPNHAVSQWDKTYAGGFGSTLLYNPDNREHPYTMSRASDLPGASSSSSSSSSSSGAPMTAADIAAMEAAQHDAAALGRNGIRVPAVVPGSSKQIYQDNENTLFAFTVLSACTNDLISRAREFRFTVRQYVPPANPEDAGKKLLERLEAEQREKRADLLAFCKEWFKETFSAWIHLKSLRMFVQSVLRFGVPPNFVAILMLPRSSGDNPHLRKHLDHFYADLGSNDAADDDDESDALILGAGAKKVYPYVFLELSLSLAQ